MEVYTNKEQCYKVEQNNALEDFKKSTHFLKTKCKNSNGQVKTVFTFVDLSCDWFGFDELAKKYKCPVANGGPIGELEIINSKLTLLFQADKSIVEYQTSVYRTNPFGKPFIEFENIVK